MADTRIAVLALCLAGGVISVAVAGCGSEEKPTKQEADGAYLRLAEGAIEGTHKIDRATEDPPENPAQVAREFGGFASNVDYTETFLLTVHDLGPVGLKAFVLSHSLMVYEATLRGVVKHARRGAGSFTRDFRGVRQAGAEVRTTATDWERALKADLAS